MPFAALFFFESDPLSKFSPIILKTIKHTVFESVDIRLFRG